VSIYVPPGGFAAAAQQTLAAQYAQSIPGVTTRRATGSRRRKKRKTKATKRRATKRKSGGRKLKFGSPAWRKKYMKK
jgi:hypothetical protein